MRKIYYLTFFLALFVTESLYAQGPNNSGTYYQAADGKKGAELKTALCGIIYNRTERTYDNLWIDFMSTDLRADGKIWDMYSNITNYQPVTKGSNYSKEGDCYNREHSWPNSWFGGKNNTQPMFADLHHLYPTDGYVNGRRSNHPLGETKGESYKSANNFSKLGKCTYPGYTGTVFEPNDEYKGDFARTYFYMVTCYEEKIASWYTKYGVNNSSAETKNAVMATLDGKTYPGLSAWQLEMLQKWAKDDPVSEKEINRNNAVYGIQKNRNPFIDYPELERFIWGDLKDVAFSYDHYQLAEQEINDTAVIEKATLHVSVGNYERFYNEDNPEFEVKYDGFVGNDDENVLITKATASTTATKTSDVGSYPIDVTGGSADNYIFSYTSGTLTINKAEQTISWEQDFTDLKVGDQVELKAVASTGLPVTYKIDNNDAAEIYSSNNKTYLDCRAEGQFTIQATQEGNKNYSSASMSKTATISVVSAVRALDNALAEIKKTPYGIRVINANIGDVIQIYSADGVLLRSVKVKGKITDIRLSNGTVYVVKVGTRTMKIGL